MAVGARKYSIPRQIAVPGELAGESGEKKGIFGKIRCAPNAGRNFSGLPGLIPEQPVFGVCRSCKSRKNNFFNFFHCLFFYCFLNSFN
jgi:hypothetical protein